MDKKKAVLDTSAQYKHSWWREVIARRESTRYDPDLDNVEPVAAPEEYHGSQASEAVSWRIRVAAAWGWRLIVITVALAGVIWGITQVSVVFIPVAIALLLTLLLEPLLHLLQKLHLPKTLAATISLLAGVGLVTFIIWLATSQLASGAPALAKKAVAGFDKLLAWLSEGPLKIDQTRLDAYIHALTTQLGDLATKYSSSIASSALSVTSSVVSIFAAALISLFCLFFFLKDGRRIWVWLIRMLPVSYREPVHEAGIRGWVTLKGYIKAQALVAFVDSICIAIGAAALGAGSMTVPLGLIVFVGSFIPIVGALATGAIAVLILLLDQGIFAAVMMLVIIVFVQQVEGNILQPIFMSNAVNIHPLAVLLAVTAGTFLAGIIGALLAVPIAAFTNTVFLYLTGHDSMPELSRKHDRIGGPPGTIHAQVAASYVQADKKETQKVLDKEAKEKTAEAADALEAAAEAAAEAEAARTKAETARNENDSKKDADDAD